MKILLLLTVLLPLAGCAQKKYEYKPVATYHIHSAGGWDYIAVHSGKLYVTHGTQVNVLDESTGDSIGIISNTPGVHGIAFIDRTDRGYTSNGRENTVSVIDLKTNALLAKVNTGKNPDAILFEPHTGTIITCNGGSSDLSVIDPATNAVVATIPVGGKPETAVSDGRGKLFVNIEDRNEIAEVDLEKHEVIAHWPLGAEAPTGLVYDAKTGRLFAGCEGLLVVLDVLHNGKVLSKLPIGDGCDGVAFDPGKNLIFTSNGSGSLTVISQTLAGNFKVVGNYPTKPGARTLAFDASRQMIFLPTADFMEKTSPGERRRMIPGSFQVVVMRNE
jgi:YVTN family beta-propeller protein